MHGPSPGYPRLLQPGLLTAPHVDSVLSDKKRCLMTSHWTDPTVFHNIAHRGASAYAPENSLEAFGLAHEHSATDIEMDVHCTADGKFVVRHGSVVDSGAFSVFVSELTFDTFQQLCVQRSERCVELVQAIQTAEDTGLGVYLDVKQVLPEAVPELVRVVQLSDFQDRVVVASFRTDIVKEVKDLAPDLLTSVLFHDPHADQCSLVAGVSCDFLHPCFDVFKNPFRFLTGPWLERARRSGAALIGWNVTTSAAADMIVAAGLRGACADDPRLLHDALLRHRSDNRTRLLGVSR